jgi:hypothetical protein
MQCEYCEKVLTTLSSLKHHQKTVKYCLAKQNKEVIKQHICSFCKTSFAVKSSLNSHLRICKSNTPVIQEQLQLLDEKSLELLETKQKFIEKDRIIQDKDRIIQDKDRIIQEQKLFIEEQKIVIKEFQDDQRKQNKDLKDRLQSMAEKAIERTWQTVVEIEQETEIPEESIDEPYELVPLELDNGYIIESRDDDGYIDVTNLCAAGKKKFKAWNRLDKTKAFLKELSSKVLISTVELIKQNTGGNGERHTWVHPQVAINIAQWISPQFDVKVSAWVLEVMMSGKIDITNTKSYRELQEDNKNKQLKIQLMTKKYVKKQPRIQYDESNVVYILTTANMKKERRYILGKATNLTSRLSVYNKSDEHEVVYYQECPDEERMSVVETLVFCKLNEYREQANRERFLLPEGNSIDLFSDTIKNCIAFVK